MSKLSFRARALDPSKQMPIYLAEELPDLPEYSAINRAVPQMPSGMEKEEESEHHLQRAICTGLIIPTPEVFTTDQEAYDRMYPPNYKMPRQLIHMQPLGLEQDVPDYDMDSSDEIWISQQSRRLDLTPLKFEQMMDRLEKSSGQMVVKLNEAKALLKQDDEVSIAVYDYWLNKRLKMQHPLILTVKTENRPGASSNNPYLAFRRRTEKMQTRKNRKNDETSYEKMLKLRRDLQRATTVLEMVKRREKTKREQLHLSIEIFEKRYQLRDFSGALLSELSSSLKSSRPAFAPLYTNQYSHHGSATGTTSGGVVSAGGATHATGVGSVLGPGGLLAAAAGANNVTPGSGGHLYASASQYLNPSTLTIDAINAGANGGGIRKEKRTYKKRKHKLTRDKQQQQQQQQHLTQQQQQQYLMGGVGNGNGLSGSALGGAGSALSAQHLLQLHRQSSSPAANESNIETEEEEFGSGGLGSGGGGHHAHKMGSESEEEAPFAFRRKQHCDYQRPRGNDGNWPWESKDDNGFGDTKYRFTLTSIRHPRPRCIGFARRRMGRGGRVMLDRITTTMDDFWSQLDYTIFESDSTSAAAKCANIKSEHVKPASPPTVVDLPLPNITNATSSTTAMPASQIPANTTIKVEPVEVPSGVPSPKHDDTAAQVSDDDGVEADFDDDDDYEEALSPDVNISRDANYISSLTMLRHRQRQRMRLQQQRRRRRLQRQKAIEESGGNSVDGQHTKRRRFNNANVVVDAKAAPVSQTVAPTKEPLPRRLLHRLSKLIDEKSMNSISSFLLSEKVKREKLNGEDVSDEVVVDLVRQQQQQQQQQQQPQQQWPNHRSNNNLMNYNNNNNSSSNINKNVGVSDKFNVIKSEGIGPATVPAGSVSVPATAAAAAAAAITAAMTSATTSGSITSTPSATAPLTKAIKQELIDCTSGGASADDSNEPLSSIKKSSSTLTETTTNSELQVVEDEENVNLAQLSSIIRHTVKKEPLDSTDMAQSTNNPTTKFNSTNSAHVNVDEDDTLSTSLNQLPDVIRQQHRLTVQRNNQLKSEHNGVENGINILIDNDSTTQFDDNYDYIGSLSPTSSQRLDICNELLSEIRRDWLHFRPKTPTDELSDSGDCKMSPTEPLVEWTQQTPIAVEMLRLSCDNMESRKDKSAHKTNEQTLSNMWDTHSDDALFVSSSFKYAELEPDTQLLQTYYAPDVTRGSSKSPDVGAAGNSNSAIDFNLSGDSLTDINLLGDGDETDENMLVNILKECDDIKTLNQATNFWNGILEGEAEVDEVAADVETDLLDCIDDKTKIKARSSRAKSGGKWHSSCATYGGTSFHTTDISSTLPDDVFFQKVQPKAEPVDPSDIKTAATLPATDATVKTEPVDDVPPVPALASSGLVSTQQQATTSIASIPAQILQNTAANGVSFSSNSGGAANVASVPQFIANNVQPQLIATTGVVHQRQPHAQLHVQQQIVTQQQPQQQQQHHQTQMHLQEVAAVGDIITVTSSNVPALQPQQQQQQQQQQQFQQVQVQQQQQQQHQILQLRQPRIQNVMQQFQQRQQILQMQRDILSGGPVITQYVSATPTNAGTTTVTTTPLRQPTLTPIGATATGNHTIYTTSTTADGTIIGGTQKIYIQKATPAFTSGTLSASSAQVPNSQSSTNTAPASVITLSNVKFENNSDGNASSSQANTTSSSAANTNILTIDGNAVTASNMSSTGSGVNIISTSGGHQVAVHSISGGAVQHLTNASGSGGTVQHLSSSASVGTTPLIVTTTTRQAQQQQQHQQLVPQQTQQIVWRQISGGSSNANSSGATTVSGADAAAAMAAAAAAAGSTGNKIVWASRPGQKRQLNGPDGATDINKLLLNRKFSQRKIITQAAQQHQIQISKHLQQLHHQQQQQQLQQQQQQQQQDDDGAANEGQTNSGGGGGVTTTLVGTTSQVAQQLQKVQMQGGKVIKMSSYPLLVSELNVAQQQQQHHQQQQKHNSAAIAANHNYSLQPTTAIITSSQSVTQQQGTGGGNKIYLTSNNASGGGTNFTIATASELANAVAVQQANSNNNSGGSSNGNSNSNNSITQKLHHYKELQNSNLKVNFVSTANASGGGSGGVGSAVSVHHGSIVVDAKTVAAAVSQSQQQQQQQATVQQQAVVLNKATANANLQQQKLKRERILNIIGASNMEVNATNAAVSSAGAGENSKRVLYTSLLNVKPLQKNNSGQMQMQIGPGGMTHALLRGRIGNNQTIFTNMRTLPIATSSAVGNATTVQQLQVAAANNSSGSGGGGNGMSVSLAQVTTNATTLSSSVAVHQQSLVNIVSSNSTAAAADVITTTAGGGVLTTSCNDLKSIENVVGSSNNSSNGNNNATAALINSGGSNSNSNSSSSSGGGNSNHAISATANNNTLASAIINRWAQPSPLSQVERWQQQHVTFGVSQLQ